MLRRQGIVKSSVSDLVCQIKITLIGSEPPIWRRLLVARNITLKTLHLITLVSG
jgi:hypothetical protein